LEIVIWYRVRWCLTNFMSSTIYSKI